jgi:hypothetical protein
MDRQLVQITLLTFVWTFVVFQVASLGAALFSVYPSNPLFLRLALLVFLAAVAAALTSMGSVWGWYIGLFYAVSSVSYSLWQIFHDAPAWRPSLLRAIAADVLFAAALSLAARNSVRTREQKSPLV